MSLTEPVVRALAGRVCRRFRSSRMDDRRAFSSRVMPACLPAYRLACSPLLHPLPQLLLCLNIYLRAPHPTPAAKDPNWKILVVDDTAMKVTSAAVGMYDIMERKVTLVESLDKKRAPFPDMGVIYLLDPTSDSVSKLIADFSGKSVLYGGSVFLYFLARLPDRLLDQIKVCKPLLKRLKCLVEVNIDFLAVQERACTLQMRDSFTSLYLRRSKSPAEGEIADKLVTVCATLNEYPHIRYRDSSANARSLASIFHVKMDQFVSQNPTWWYHGGPSRKSSQSGAAKRDRGVLLLVDRADDCLTPLMHDFTYQAMVRDLLPLQGDRITYQNETTNDPTQTEARDVLLDERDKLWVELRSKHIALVIETLSSRIREIMNSSTGSSLSKKSASGNLSLSQMAAALKALPEYKEVMSKLSQHMHISHECMDLFRNQRLLDLSELEQTLATGKDEDGRSPKLTDMLERVEDELIRIKSKEGRLRLILVTIVSQGGLGSSERRRLMNAAELTRKDQRTLNALEILGMSIFNSSNKSGGAMSSMFGYVQGYVYQEVA
jgi:syntaxin-binding protein 1